MLSGLLPPLHLLALTEGAKRKGPRDEGEEAVVSQSVVTRFLLNYQMLW